VNRLYDHRVGPSIIASIIEEKHGTENGTFLPKTIFNINEKSQNLIHNAQGIKASWTDAEKLIRILEM
jgi:hypothetical protein